MSNRTAGLLLILALIALAIGRWLHTGDAGVKLRARVDTWVRESRARRDSSVEARDAQQRASSAQLIARSSAFLASLQGSWEGVYSQGGSTNVIRLSVDEPQSEDQPVVGIVEYPDFGCRAELRIRQLAPDTATLTSTTVQQPRPGACATSAILTLTRGPGDDLVADIHFTDIAGRPVYLRATLIRTTRGGVPTSIRPARLAGAAYSISANTWAFPTGGQSYPSVRLKFGSGIVVEHAGFSWEGEYTTRGDSLCLLIKDLRPPGFSISSSLHREVAVGYDVELRDRLFPDHALSRTVLFFRTFEGDTPPERIEECIPTIPLERSNASLELDGVWEGDVQFGEETPRFILRMRVLDTGRVDGAMLMDQTYRGRSEQERYKIDGVVSGEWLSLVRKGNGTALMATYVARVSGNPGLLGGVVKLGTGEGQWRMLRVADLDGSVDAFERVPAAEAVAESRASVISEKPRAIEQPTVLAEEAPRLRTQESLPRYEGNLSVAYEVGRFRAYGWEYNLLYDKLLDMRLVDFLNTFTMERLVAGAIEWQTGDSNVNANPGKLTETYGRVVEFRQRIMEYYQATGTGSSGPDERWLGAPLRLFVQGNLIESH